MNTVRVVVCGTTFGRIYINGIKKLADKFSLVAILSQGSEQSRRLAEQLGVPLCTKIEDLPAFDLACVVVRSSVVGGSGTQLALEFLSRGKHVVMEHPIHKKDSVDCYRMAAKNNVQFKLNTFYRWNPTISRYLEIATTLTRQFKIIHIDAECSIHFLFSTLDIIGRITGGFTPWSFDDDTQVTGIFTTLTGSIRKTPLCLRVVNHNDSEKPDDFAHVGHRITVFTHAGNLVLTETDGTIIWHPNTPIPRDQAGLLSTAADDRLSTLQLHENLLIEPCVTRVALYDHTWPAGIAEFLNEVYDKLACSKNEAQEAEYLLALCAVWARTGQLLGPTCTVQAAMHAEPLSLESLMWPLGESHTSPIERNNPNHRNTGEITWMSQR